MSGAGRTTVRWCWGVLGGIAVLLAANSRGPEWFAAPTARKTDSTDHQAVWISGRVVDQQTAVAGARVRWKGSTDFTTSDAHGRFRLPTAAASLPVTAWKQGYLIGSAHGAGGEVTIELTPLPRHDHAAYRWIDPTPDALRTDNCGQCHGEIYKQWQRGGHAHSATNRRFLDLYGGRQGESAGQGDWNLLAELPHGAAVCASCHAPALEFDDPASEDLRLIGGTSAHGVHCDFCHKVQDVLVDQVGLSHGRFAMRLLRPEKGQLFFGPLEDVDRGEDTFSPVQRESRYCAACHEGTLFGVHVYQTYSEWLASPARREGKQCQTCHMAPDGALTNIAPEMGGIERDPQTLASHDLFPGGQQSMLRRALEMEVEVGREEEAIDCQIEVTARGVGHRVPTGFVDRHLILAVEAFDDAGKRLPAQQGPLLPAAAGDLAGHCGKLFGRLLHDDLGRSPVPFWRAAGEATDTRLHPERGETLALAFPTSTARIEVRLIYRRFWQQVAQAKGWPEDELLIFQRDVPVEPQAGTRSSPP